MNSKTNVHHTVFIAGPVSTNSYVLWCETSGTREGLAKEAIIVDPPVLDSRLAGFLKKQNLTVKAIILTHLHFDHIMGADAVKQICGAPILMGWRDAEDIDNDAINGLASFGMPAADKPSIDRTLHEQDEISIGDAAFTVIETPGHTKGGICLYTPGILLAGDTLFYGSVGRTDLTGGDMNELKSSIREKLYSLPDDTLVLPGHGSPTELGREKKMNPFVKA